MRWLKRIAAGLAALVVLIGIALAIYAQRSLPRA